MAAITCSAAHFLCLKVCTEHEDMCVVVHTQARFFNHLLPRAQAAAAPDETAAITRLRKELPSLKEFNRPWYAVAFA